MGLLAYDPERLRQLLGALERDTDELGRVRIADPAGREAAQQLNQAVRELADWPRTIRNIVSCTALANYDPVTNLDSSNLAHASASYLRQTYSLLAIDGPIGLIGSPSTDARALAEAIAAADRRELLSEANVAYLASVLPALLADPLGRQTFLDTLGEDGLVRLINHIGHHWRVTGSMLDPSPQRQASLEGLVGVLGAAIGAGTNTGLRSDVLLRIDDPYLAAVALSEMDIDPAEFARIAYDVIESAGPIGPVTTYAPTIFGYAPPQRMPGELLLSMIADDVTRSVVFVELAAGGNLDVLLNSAHDFAAIDTIIRVGTNPANVTDVDSAFAEIVMPILAYATTSLEIPTWPSTAGGFLGGFVIDYPHKFASMAGEATATSPSAGEAAAALRFILGFAAAEAAIRQGAGRLFERLSNELAAIAPGDLEDLMLAAGGTMDMIAVLYQRVLDAITDGHVADAESARETLSVLLGIGVGAGVGKVFGRLVGAGLAAASDWAGPMTEAAINGAVVSPNISRWLPDPADIGRAYAGLTDAQLTAMTGQMLKATYDALISVGLLAPSAPMPPIPPATGPCPGSKYSAAVDEWTRRLAAEDWFVGGDANTGVAIGELLGSATQLINPTSADRRCLEATS